MRNNFFWIFLLINSISVCAQSPVDIKCFADDTLYWEYVEDPSCTFLQHTIFFSSSLDEPFVEAGVVNNSNIESFDFSSFGFLGEIFFYVSSSFDCGSLVEVFSDTINSLPPDLVEISFLDVTPNGILINWIDLINDIDDHQYVIYKTTPSGVNPIGSVSNDYTFLDESAAQVDQSETYYVLAEDDCGSLSIFDSPHSSMFLGFDYDPCFNVLNASWTLMEDAESTLDSLRLSIVHESGFSEFVSLGLDQVEMSYDIETGLGEYCLELYAYYPNGDIATSNQVCSYVNIPPQLDVYQITNVTNTGNTIKVDWFIDDEDAVKTFEVSGTNDDGLSVWSSGSIDFNTTVGLSIEDPVNWDSDAGLVNYTVNLVNFCDLEYTTEPFGNIYLDMQVDNSESLYFTWETLVPDYVTPLEYELYRIEGSEEFLLETIEHPASTFSYTLSNNDIKSNGVMFELRRTALAETQSSGLIQFSSVSNRVEYVPKLKLVLPNAINPQSKNDEFKPVLVSGVVDTYKLSIFDRYGQLLFESIDIENGWKAKRDLEYFPSGVYQYAISVIDVQGVDYEYSGVLTLVR